MPARIAIIVGARPQFIKAGSVSNAITAHNRAADYDEVINDVLIHTGQHYDDEISADFPETPGLASQEYILGISSRGHGVQLAKTSKRLDVLIKTTFRPYLQADELRRTHREDTPIEKSTGSSSRCRGYV
jgi:UDP-N-acetylglucosamine 2-epimerase